MGIYISRTPPPSISPPRAGFFSSIVRPSMSAAMTAIAIGVLVMLSFIGGFAVADWRASGKLERAQALNDSLTTANQRCGADLETVNKAVKAMLDIAIEREKQAQEAVDKAQPVIERHKAKVIQIRKLAPVPVDRQCAVIIEEQAAYIQARRDDE